MGRGLAGKRVEVEWIIRNQEPTHKPGTPKELVKQRLDSVENVTLRGQGKHQTHYPAATDEHVYRYPYTRQDSFPDDGKPPAKAVNVHERPSTPAPKTFRPRRLGGSALGDGAAVVGSPYRTLEESNVVD